MGLVVSVDGNACGRGPDRRGTQPSLARDVAASEVIGSILLVGITVVVTVAFVALSFGTLSDDEPAPVAELDHQVESGDGVWGNGDEHLVVRHKGGQAIRQADFVVVVRVGDGGETRYADGGANPVDHADQDAFGSGDDAFTIGERWRTPDLTIGEETAVDTAVVGGGSGGHLVSSGAVRSGTTDTDPCASDTDPPTVSSWIQDPPDVSTATSGPVAVTATLSDACSSVDTTSDPHLLFRVNDGSDPAFTDAGAMTLQSGTTWQGSIPDQTWIDEGGETLEYKLVDMRDQLGNTGDSAVQQDAIETVTTYSYVQTPLDMVTGTSANDANARSADDAGAAATLTEAVSSTPTSFTLDANGFVDTSDTWDTKANGFTSDDQYATTTDTNPVRYTLSAPSPITTVSSVVLRAEVSITNHNNDAFTLAACFPSGSCGDASSQLGSSGSDVNVQYDVTQSSQHPLGNASWTQSDLDALQVRITPIQNGGDGPPRDGTWRVDRAWTSVSGTHAGAYDLESDAWTFDQLGSGSSHTLETRYRTVGAETYDLQVFDGSTWTTRATLDQSTFTVASHTLTTAEADAGPQTRILDAGTDDNNQGELELDHVRVVNNP